MVKGVRKNPAVMRKHQLEGSVEQNPVAEESEDEDIEGEGESAANGQKKAGFTITIANGFGVFPPV